MSAALVERPLVVSPSLAATIGLEGALLYQLLADWSQLQDGRAVDDRTWHLIDKERLLQLLPFWEMPTIEQVLRQLQEQGLIIIGAGLTGNASNIRFALVSSGSAPAEQPAAAERLDEVQTARPYSAAGATVIDGSWRPDRESVEYLTRFHGVDPAFIDSLVPEFIAHWRETGEARASWNSTFTQHVSKRWKKHRYQQVEEARTVQMRKGWEPSDDAVQILSRSGIDENFIWDAVPEFILYWQERGTFDRNWNSRFVEHVRRQWAYYTNAMGGETEPTRIPENWQPGEAVYDILRMANIDLAFARSLIPEFVLYWRDSKQLQRSWNSKFLQHVKYRWASSHELGSTHERRQNTGGNPQSESAKIFQKLTDRSWAEGLVGKSHER